MMKRGFTLIELLVVISIIALLISIILPALSEARQMAYSVVCQSNERQIGMAMLMYANENDEYFPNKQPVGVAGDASNYMWLGDAGLAEPQSIYGREARFRPLNRYLGNSEESSEIRKCPADADHKRWSWTGTSYAMNGWYADTDSDGENDYKSLIKSLLPDNRHVSIRIADISTPTEFVFGGDEAANLAAYRTDAADWSEHGAEFGDLFWHYASRKWNVLFADGHVGIASIRNYGDLTGDGYTFERDQ